MLVPSFLGEKPFVGFGLQPPFLREGFHIRSTEVRMHTLTITPVAFHVIS